KERETRDYDVSTRVSIWLVTHGNIIKLQSLSRATTYFNGQLIFSMSTRWFQ
ncbi:unnamed protein product, partial [Eruca vesicaria subsp. sativa]|nr:unnamed protein product [Eruca vesicaria subsp. sativa]